MKHCVLLAQLGIAGVGKTAIASRFVTGLFSEEYDPTVEYLLRKQFKVDSESIKMEIFDVVGEEEHSALNDQALRMGEGFLVTYSIKDKYSFGAIDSYLRQIQRAKDAEFYPTVIVGNMCDLENCRQVTTDEGAMFAEKCKAPFYESSAKFGFNIIVRAFKRLGPPRKQFN